MRVRKALRTDVGNYEVPDEFAWLTHPLHQWSVVQIGQWLIRFGAARWKVKVVYTWPAAEGRSIACLAFREAGVCTIFNDLEFFLTLKLDFALSRYLMRHCRKVAAVT